MAAKRKKPKKPVTLPFTGDHGTGTEAATADTVLVPIKGQKHNRTARRQRRNTLAEMHERGELSLRQWQAGDEIQCAWAACEKLSSGSPLKEQVDTSARPDQHMAARIDAQSRFNRAMAAVPSKHRRLVEIVCWFNQPIRSAPGRQASAKEALRYALEQVANHLRY